MDNLILKDTLRVSDSAIKGFVVVTDEKGNVIFKKNNMIVEGGRDYIKNLVFTNISGGAESRKIASAKFGYGTTTTSPENIDLDGKLGNNYLYEYALDTTNLVWTEYIEYPYSFGSTIPTSGIVNEKFFNISDNKLYTFTTNWGSGVSITSAIQDPTTGTLTEGTFYFNTLNNKLYIRETKVALLPSHLGIGIKLNIVLEGSSVYEATSELGLFLNDNTLFSRLVFDPIPIATGFKYRLTYYIYF
jgi:hypothetical protein